jgi:hypothetical protein
MHDLSLAGHGYTDALDPLKSKLLLDDWKDNPLTVNDLLDVNIRRDNSAFLVYLSAVVPVGLRTRISGTTTFI